MPDLLVPGVRPADRGDQPGLWCSAAGVPYAHPDNWFWPTTFRRPHRPPDPGRRREQPRRPGPLHWPRPRHHQPYRPRRRPLPDARAGPPVRHRGPGRPGPARRRVVTSGDLPRESRRRRLRRGRRLLAHQDWRTPSTPAQVGRRCSDTAPWTRGRSSWKSGHAFGPHTTRSRSQSGHVAHDSGESTASSIASHCDLEPCTDTGLTLVVPVDVRDKLGTRLRMESEAEAHALRAASRAARRAANSAKTCSPGTVSTLTPTMSTPDSCGLLAD